MQGQASRHLKGEPSALAEVERLERDGRLAGYQYLPAVKADLLARLGRGDAAAGAYRQALDLTANEAERASLAGRLAAWRATARERGKPHPFRMIPALDLSDCNLMIRIRRSLAMLPDCTV